MGDNRGTRQWRRLKAEVRARRGPCWLCGQPIDYDRPARDPLTGEDDPEAFSVDHKQPWSLFPHLRYDPGNLAPAHLGCNRSRGNRDAAPSLGLRSREW